MQEKLAKAEKQNELLNSQKSDIEKELNEQKQTLEQQTAHYKKLQDEQKAIDADLAKAKSDLEQQKQTYNKLQDDKNTTDIELEKAKLALAEKENAYKTLETQKSAIETELNSVKENLASLNQNAAAWNVINLKLSELLTTPGELETPSFKKEEDNSYAVRITKQLNPQDLNNGLYKRPAISMTSGDSGDGIMAGDYYIYKQTFSTIYAYNWLAGSESGKNKTASTLPRGGSFRISYFDNNKLTTDIPDKGQATYRGESFNADNKGKLEYTVDFNQRTGSGRIYDQANHLPDISLDSGNINGSNIRSTASINEEQAGIYQVSFYGDQAQEIAGEVYIDRELENAVRTNGNTQAKYEGKVRGVAFGIAGTKQQ
ncbi:transferrin-binding protein-like solute binding protein [Gallibacterium salpingitidis]|uniref:factor H binding protein domain-containing protein n=1 Tax=Gallibacterium salpingitidis TaxID=505341 RepID=UPI0026702B35|nr:factor H binding protein domain-containing protein [Gallibacterium salpingitidis]WKS99339.1 transferrin-binding protein-like solute binding protein [Gallibacterium salpingitidis]